MAVVLVHGLGQGPDSWKRVAALLSEHQIYAHSPDLLEWINSEHGEYSAVYQQFEKYCNELNQPLDLCGLSLGGILALEYTIKNPSKVSSLALINTQFKIPKFLFSVQRVIFSMMPSRIFQQMKVGKSNILYLFETMKHIDFSTHLKEINVPTLIISGEKDTFNRSASTEMANTIKNSFFQIIKNAGHEINTEQPEELFKQISAFYTKIH